MLAAGRRRPRRRQQQVYRYIDKDGHVVYSDRAPPGDSKDVQAKRLGANYIETNELPLRRAAGDGTLIR